MTYYDEVIQEIRTAIQNRDLDTAAFLLKKELSMPYIPEDTEAELRQLSKDLRFLRAENRERTEIPLEKLLRMLKGRAESQLRAADLLCERNLRAVTNEIRDYLSKDPLPEAAAIILEGLAEQAVAQEFVLCRGGVEYEFYGDALIPVTESEGFLEAHRILEDRYMKEPSLLDLARTMLVSKCYLALPLSYEKEDGKQLAEECAGEVEQAMGRGL